MRVGYIFWHASLYLYACLFIAYGHAQLCTYGAQENDHHVRVHLRVSAHCCTLRSFLHTLRVCPSVHIHCIALGSFMRIRYVLIPSLVYTHSSLYEYPHGCRLACSLRCLRAPSLLHAHLSLALYTSTLMHISYSCAYARYLNPHCCTLIRPLRCKRVPSLLRACALTTFACECAHWPHPAGVAADDGRPGQRRQL